MRNHPIYTSLNFIIALIWLANGLLCKVLNLVPRHELIVARITGSAHPRLLTILIGLSEIAMAAWIMSGIKSRLNAVCQIILIAFMNMIEFAHAQDLLLWGKFNALFALILILAIYLNEFLLKKKMLKS